MDNLKHTNQKGFNSVVGSLKNVQAIENLMLPLLTTAAYVQWLSLIWIDFFPMSLGFLKMFGALLCSELWEHSEIKRTIHSIAAINMQKKKINKGDIRSIEFLICGKYSWASILFIPRATAHSTPSQLPA